MIERKRQTDRERGSETDRENKTNTERDTQRERSVMSLMGGVVPQEGWMCVDFFWKSKKKERKKKVSFG